MLGNSFISTHPTSSPRLRTVKSPLDKLCSYRADLSLLGIGNLHPDSGIGVPEVEQTQLERDMKACPAQLTVIAGNA